MKSDYLERRDKFKDELKELIHSVQPTNEVEYTMLMVLAFKLAIKGIDPSKLDAYEKMLIAAGEEALHDAGVPRGQYATIIKAAWLVVSGQVGG